jgi:hypothetical protein
LGQFASQAPTGVVHWIVWITAGLKRHPNAPDGRQRRRLWRRRFGRRRSVRQSVVGFFPPGSGKSVILWMSLKLGRALMIGKTVKFLLIVSGFLVDGYVARADGSQWVSSAKSMFQYVAEGYKVVATSYYQVSNLDVNIKESDDASGFVRVPAFKGTLLQGSPSWAQFYILQKETSVVRCSEVHIENIENNCATLIEPSKEPHSK